MVQQPSEEHGPIGQRNVAQFAQAVQAQVGEWRYKVEVEIHGFHVGGAMAVRIEKKGKVWTVIHSRREARNAMDPESADALVAAFQAFDRDAEAAVAVLWG